MLRIRYAFQRAVFCKVHLCGLALQPIFQQLKSGVQQRKLEYMLPW
jgi:hypothetical protein